MSASAGPPRRARDWPHHRELDDVRRRALDDGVDGEPLAELARLASCAPAAAPEQRRHVAVLARLLDRLGHEAATAGKREVAVDERLRLLLLDVSRSASP